MREKKQRLRDQLLILFLAPIWIPLGICLVIIVPIAILILYLSIWSFWSTRGIRLLFVHSNSPVWQDHIRNEILPRLPERSIILNWSERKKWRLSLATMAFHHFGSYRHFNPLGVVIKPFHRAKIFRFHEASADFKHGNPNKLLKIESDFFATLEK